MEIRQILESQYIKGNKVTFSFPNAMYEHAKNQLNSFIYSFIIEIQQIIESHDLKDKPIFDLAHPITIKLNFSFL